MRSSWVAGVAIMTACSSAPPPVCEPSACKLGNVCTLGFDTFDAELAGATSIACRRPCSAPSDCPFDFHCADPGSAVATCAPDRHAFAPRDGQWGASCNPGNVLSLGSCDVEQGFACMGDAADDGTAFCTQLDCVDDGDCTGGFWCAVINDPQNLGQAPSVGFSGDAITQHAQRSVCLPRAWDLRPLTRCAPCKSDVECPADDGVAQHCAPLAGGTFACVRECAADAECTFDAHCNDDGVCIPNAPACVWAGAFGDPCRSDLDCKTGYCTRAAYSNELFCTERVANPSVACISDPPCNTRVGKLGSASSAACVDLTSSGLAYQCVPTQNIAPYVVYAGFWSRTR